MVETNSNSHLIKRISRDERRDIVRAKTPDESDNTVCITDSDVVSFSGNTLVQDKILGSISKFLILPEPRDPYKNVAMISRDERGVNPKMSSNRRARPASGKRTPRSVKSLKRKIAKVCLKKLSHVVTKFHMKIAIKDNCVFALSSGWNWHGIVKDVKGWFAKNPRVTVVTRDYPHAYA